MNQRLYWKSYSLFLLNQGTFDLELDEKEWTDPWYLHQN